jgi:hypothetical protein
MRLYILRNVEKSDETERLGCANDIMPNCAMWTYDK